MIWVIGFAFVLLGWAAMALGFKNTALFLFFGGGGLLLEGMITEAVKNGIIAARKE